MFILLAPCRGHFLFIGDVGAASEQLPCVALAFDLNLADYACLSQQEWSTGGALLSMKVAVQHNDIDNHRVPGAAEVGNTCLQQSASTLRSEGKGPPHGMVKALPPKKSVPGK